MSNENNKFQIDIDNLFKQNVNDLTSIKELYRKLEEIEKKITQIKYIDGNLANKLKKEYEKLKKIILDENVQAKLSNDIEEINLHLETSVSYIKMKLDVLNEDNSIPFNFICNEMKKDIKLNGIGSNNIIAIQSGVYKFNNSITIPSYIKLKPIGTVIFEFTGNDNFINISPEDDLGFNKQMYFRGSLIDGSNGGLIIRTTNKTDTVGITIGDLNSGNQMCRYNLNDIAIL